MCRYGGFDSWGIGLVRGGEVVGGGGGGGDEGEGGGSRCRRY